MPHLLLELRHDSSRYRLRTVAAREACLQDARRVDFAHSLCNGVNEHARHFPNGRLLSWVHVCDHPRGTARRSQAFDVWQLFSHRQLIRRQHRLAQSNETLFWPSLKLLAQLLQHRQAFQLLLLQLL